eukprot:Skav224978  [mRNA]  locus=scaffold560:139372:144468:+ [translate_table: standard]
MASGSWHQPFLRAFQALYAGALGKVSPVDAAMARKVARGVESRAEMPQNLVMFTLYHRSSMLGRACSSITPVRTETLPLSLAAEKAHFSLELPPTLPELLDEWLFRHLAYHGICHGIAAGSSCVGFRIAIAECAEPQDASTLLFDGYLRALNPIIPRVANKTELAKHSGA